MSTFKLTLKRVDPMKIAVIYGAVVALFSLIIVVPVFFLMSLAGASSGLGEVGLGLFGGGIAVLFVPVLYGVFGFIFGLICALVFNFVLSKTKGLDLDFEKAGMEISQLGNNPD